MTTDLGLALAVILLSVSVLIQCHINRLQARVNQKMIDMIKLLAGPRGVLSNETRESKR